MQKYKKFLSYNNKVKKNFFNEKMVFRPCCAPVVKWISRAESTQSY